MATKLTSLSLSLQREICFYMPTRHLMRFASTCKAAHGVALEDENSWRARAVALRVILQDKAGPAVRQIQHALRLEPRLQRAYEIGVAGGPRLYFITIQICATAAICGMLWQGFKDTARAAEISSGKLEFNSMETERSKIPGEIFQLALDRYDSIKYLLDNSTAEVSKIYSSRTLNLREMGTAADNVLEKNDRAIRLLEMRFDSVIEKMHEREYGLHNKIALARADQDQRIALSQKSAAMAHTYNVGLGVGMTVLGLTAIVDSEHPHVEYPWLNRYCAAVGALSLGWGVICLSHDLPAPGIPLVTNGSLMFVRGVTSYQYVTGVFGEARGRWNVACIRTASSAKRLLRSPPCERVTSNLYALKNSVVAKAGQAAGLLTAIASRALRFLPF